MLPDTVCPTLRLSSPDDVTVIAGVVAAAVVICALTCCAPAL